MLLPISPIPGGLRGMIVKTEIKREVDDRLSGPNVKTGIMKEEGCLICQDDQYPPEKHKMEQWSNI